jgi:(2Fe-2S) ferredoxin
MDEASSPEKEPGQPGLLSRPGVASARRHVFVCIGPECCATAEGEALWELMKRRMKETSVPAMRTKAACLRVCTAGPWLVVYPEGIWYGGVTAEKFEVILQKHLLGGWAVEEWIAGQTGCTLGPAAP